MKTVFRSNEIAHIWANEGAPSGHNPCNHMSFDGDAFYSYSTVIARRIRGNGKVGYLLDTYNFSNSTSKHKSHFRHAIPNADKVFFIESGSRGQSLNYSPVELRDRYLAAYRDACNEMPSRYSRIRAEQYQKATGFVNDALDVCTYFGLGTHRVNAILAARVAGEANASETLKLARDRKIALAKTADTRAKKERRERNIHAAENFIAGKDGMPTGWIDLEHKQGALDTLPEELKAAYIAKANEFNASLTARWIAGENVHLRGDGPTLLRASRDEEEMETSKGAYVPLDDAKRSYLFAKKMQAKGWHRNGEQHQIGRYQLDAINENGVVAGCHRVSWSEIDRFGASQGWTVEVVS